MKKVMLIEDEELILEGLTNILDWKELNMEVVHKAHNGEEALRYWKLQPVDIVITDIEMPVMGGLELLHEIRNIDKRVRFIILTGYDEFEYARKAIHLDVEDYILKPIDEEKLELTLRRAYDKLNEIDRKKAVNIDDEAGWLCFLRGSLEKEEEEKYLEILPKIAVGQSVYGGVMKIEIESLQTVKISDLLVELQKEKNLRVIYLSSDSLFILLYTTDRDENEVYKFFLSLQNKIESTYDVFTFISLASPFNDYKFLPACYREIMKLQKYQVIEGYGSCVAPGTIKNRKSEDISIDDSTLRKMIFKKDKEAALSYIEDLFINNVKKNSAVEDIFQMALQIAMILQNIKSEYNLNDRKNMQNLIEIIDRIYHAEDLFTLKTIFIGEIIQIIDYLHEDDSQYTPVIKQIMAEVEKKYKEDMNLKMLSYKYNMNASYLGQIFQKEVGCSFAQYLSNKKNGDAKDLILNTNMKINDIAKEVGYQDTSYFYRKFKKCYGVSPASLREMKKY
ncbi:response regulator transcription factor [Anaerocolumna aminovalerica]|uniref:Stage 0 sporulation protein A homolog n=1 Tax=Anaerocolumna aminovalerica TaxID=1527 RepID=A0A1I5BS79_9FIRM|nr:response regulator [Anaerocolumna aminovalerica]SFN77559.1 two component transcriptional regulator, AraC family [Anaerocolumna aminovalerica]